MVPDPDDTEKMYGDNLFPEIVVKHRHVAEAKSSQASKTYGFMMCLGLCFEPCSNVICSFM